MGQHTETTKSPWAHILSPAEIDAHHALTASIDPRFAATDRAFYESRTGAQLANLAAGAWNCNDPTGYQVARSYAALPQVSA